MKASLVKINYCQPCGFEKQAKHLAEEIRSPFSGKIDSVEIEPTEKIGFFEVFLDDELLYSKISEGRMPHPGEIEQILIKKIVSANGR